MLVKFNEFNFNLKRTHIDPEQDDPNSSPARINFKSKLCTYQK